uniref:PARP n=1 Tax=Strongyloides venezuelensis TaxID=75913 RepID=A0A0K0F4F7_STRVS
MVTANKKDVNELERTYQSAKDNCYLRKIVNHIKFSGDNFKVAEHLRFDKEKEMSIGSREMKNAMRHIGESMVTSTIDISRISVGGMPDPHVYNHGGASYVVSKRSVKEQTNEAIYDLEVGYNLERLGVISSKSLDSRDRVLFNVLDPSQTLSQYNTSMTSVADFPVTFYYVRNEMMCVLVFFCTMWK